MAPDSLAQDTELCPVLCVEKNWYLGPALPAQSSIPTGLLEVFSALISQALCKYQTWEFGKE